MAQIPSYTTGSLKLSDYLIGTDVSSENVTRSMPVSDIVASILAAKSIGTVTSISTSNSTYINLAGGPITTTGSLTASLSASGTPSSATYLRGDGTWSEPGPTPTDIITYSTSVPLTTDTASWKFANTGVTASSINNNVQVDIPGLLSSVDSVLDGVAITVTGSTTTNPSTGDITVVNAGVYQARAGGNVTLTGSATPLQYSSAVTVSTTANPGTVVGVNAGVGTLVTNINTNPEIDINYTGSGNFIQSNIETISSDDIIAFQDLSASEVKTAKLNTIPASTLTSITEYIDDGLGTASNSGDRGKVKNIDTFTNVWKAKEMVTLSISEYNAICPGTDCDANTLYLIVGAGTAYTATYNVTYNVTGGAINQGWTASIDVNDGTGWVAASSLTAVAGTVYEWRISLALINGYTYVSGSLVSVSGSLTMPSNNTIDNISITAAIQAPAQAQCLVTLGYIINIGGTGSWTYGGDPAGTAINTTQSAQYMPQGSATGGIFNATILPGVGSTITSPLYYSWAGSPAGYTPAASVFPGDVTVTGTITGPTTYQGELIIDHSQVVTTGGASTAYLNDSATSSCCNGSWGKIISGLVAGASFGWNTPGVTAGSQPNGTLTWTPASPLFKYANGSTVVWNNTMASIPPAGGNTPVTVYTQGTLAFVSNVQPQFRKADWLAQLQGLGATSNTVIANAQQGPVNGNSPSTYTYTTPSVTPGTGYYFTSSGSISAFPTVTFDVTGGASGSGTNVDPLIENPLTVTGSWTVVESQVTVVIVHNLCSGCTDAPTWQVTASTTGSSGGGGTNSQTWTLNGIGSPAATFNIGGSSQVTFSISRTGAQYCLPSACMGGSLYQFPCPSNYRCPTNNPKYSGSWTVTSPGSNTGNRSWTGASVNGLGTIIPGGTQAYASGLSNGDTVTLTLIEQ